MITPYKLVLLPGYIPLSEIKLKKRMVPSCLTPLFVLSFFCYFGGFMNLKKFNDDAISIQAFLSKYLGVCVENKRLTHEQVKHLFPDIERSSFEDIIKSPELIYTGVVILVKDFKGELIPYYNYHKDLNNSEEDFELDSREKLVVALVTRINSILS